MTTDQRKIFTHKRLVTECGTVFHFDGKYDPARGRLKVYRVYGDVTRPDDIDDALHTFTQGLGLLGLGA